MMEEKSPASPTNAIGDVDRLNYLIQSYDKLIDRYESSFSSLNQKATWTLATATALAAITGFTNRFPVFVESPDNLSGIFYLDVLVFALFALAYLAILRHVLAVYRPSKSEFPITALNVSKLGRPVSRYDDKGKYGEQCWFDIQKRYVEPTELVFMSNLLRAYIDTIIEAHLRNQKMSSHVQGAFDLLPLLALLSLILWLLS